MYSNTRTGMYIFLMQRLSNATQILILYTEVLLYLVYSMPSPLVLHSAVYTVLWWSGCLVPLLNTLNILKYCIYSIVYSYSMFPVLNYLYYILLVAESKSMLTLDDCQKLGLVQSSLACQYGSTCFSHNTTTV